MQNDIVLTCAVTGAETLLERVPTCQYPQKILQKLRLMLQKLVLQLHIFTQEILKLVWVHVIQIV